MSHNDLITLRDNLDPAEAQILRARLEAEGIPAYLLGEQHVQIDWTASIALGGVRLQVRTRDEGPARAILAAIERGDYALDDDADVANENFD